MTFTSFEFLLFFPLVVLFYNIVPTKGRLWYLLGVSYLFYALMQPVYLVLLATVTLLTYGVTRWLVCTDNEDKKKWIEVLGILVVLLPLFFFKYFNWVGDGIESLLSSIGFTIAVPEIKWLLPVGISFYTFMSIGYIVDSYNEEVDVEKNIGSVGLFLSFFPIILSGPIERAGNMFPQFKDMQRSKPSDLTAGAKMMLWGYFMKLCVADRLGLYVDAIFGNIAQHNGSSLAFASLLFPIQLYADLGGYSLIAIGAARCMGLKIMPNFNRPFFATSVSEFWRRWHMSFIQWLTDYIYTPLTFMFRKQKIFGVVLAIFCTFLISGIWHGTGLTHIMWGVSQALFLSVEAVTLKQRSAFEKKHNLENKGFYIAICCFIVYILFSFSQSISKCGSVEDWWNVLTKIFTNRGTLFVDSTTLGYAGLMILILAFKDFRDEFFPDKLKLFESKYIVVRFISYISILFVVINMGVLDGGQFIYFQF